MWSKIFDFRISHNFQYCNFKLSRVRNIGKPEFCGTDCCLERFTIDVPGVVTTCDDVIWCFSPKTETRTIGKYDIKYANDSPDSKRINRKNKIDILFCDTFFNTGSTGAMEKLTDGIFFLHVIMLSKLIG